MCETEKMQLGERFFIYSEAAKNAVVTFPLTELSLSTNAEHLLKHILPCSEQRTSV